MDNEKKQFRLMVEVPADDLTGYYTFLAAAKENGVKIVSNAEYKPRPDLRGPREGNAQG